MTDSITLDNQLKPIKYAWPGGYPVFYIAREGYLNDETGKLELSKYDRAEFVCCADCAAKAQTEKKILIGSAVNWEDVSLYCEVCSKLIESAYGDNENEKMEFDAWNN